MTRRDLALATMRAAGYHEDRKTWTRAYVESRVSFPLAQRAFNDGQQAREQGARCRCYECDPLSTVEA